MPKYQGVALKSDSLAFSHNDQTINIPKRYTSLVEVLCHQKLLYCYRITNIRTIFTSSTILFQYSATLLQFHSGTFEAGHKDTQSF